MHILSIWLNQARQLHHSQVGKPTSQKNSFPRREENQEIHDTSSELLILPVAIGIVCMWSE